MAVPITKKNRYGRAGRFVLIVMITLVLVTAMFLFASVLFAHDPDGHQVRDWLNASRYGLFIWRLTMYVFLGWLWFCVVRPKVLKQASAPSSREALRRLEWVAAAFIMIIEFAAWRSVLA